MSSPPRDSERTPLLNGSRRPTNGDGHKPTSDDAEGTSLLTRVLGPPNTLKLLLAGYIISLAFSQTQVPIFYAFHLIECDLYYARHPPYTGTGDRCSVPAVAAAASLQLSILGMATTFCGTWNLFMAGWSVKRWGPRAALVLQTLFPALRVAVQTVGVYLGGQAGVVVIQCSQVVTVLGGPSGYILVVNTMAGELVSAAQRTAVFGKLQGCIMLGTATGFLLGGAIGNTFGIRMPFQVAVFLFCGSAVYAGLVLPYLSPEAMSGGGNANRAASSRKGFLAPLRILAPQIIRLPGGTATAKHYGVFFLCCGIFLSVLATSYAPILIQMYATTAFDFNQADNGWLMSGNSLVRGVFLLFIFPRIIALGRKWWTAKNLRPEEPHSPVEGEAQRTLTKRQQQRRRDSFPTEPEEFDAPAGPQPDEEPVTLEPLDDEDRGASQFDLYFLRWSLVVDGALTTLAAFGTQGWHMYLAAYLLPFGSGSAPAAKGVITEMIPASQRADALNAITLVENIARLLTVGCFGLLFSALADAGKAYLTFFCNAAIAVVGMLVLCLSHFPPEGSELIEDELLPAAREEEDG